jgi:hypothetical protein
MRFEWNVNPLETSIFLDDSDRKYLRLAIRIEAALSAISHRDLRDRAKTPEGAERYAKYIKNYDDVAFDEDEVSADIDKRVEMFEAELQGPHVGDCICFACTCTKCWAESLLDIDTIAGLSKHEASKIDSCFTDTTTKPWSRKTLTADQVIAELSTPINREKNEHWKNSSQEEYERHIPRWEAEREQALQWYKAYIKEHSL